MSEYILELDIPFLKEDIQKILNVFTPREKVVINERYGLLDGRPKTLQEIGYDYQVTRERVRQIECKAMRRLKHPKYSRFLRKYVPYNKEFEKQYLLQSGLFEPIEPKDLNR
jgi:RNA polymerase primary sigma factor